MALFQPVLSEPGPALESLVIRVFRQVIPAKMIVRFGASVAALFCAIARFLGFTSRLPGVAFLLVLSCVDHEVACILPSVLSPIRPDKARQVRAIA